MNKKILVYFVLVCFATICVNLLVSYRFADTFFTTLKQKREELFELYEYATYLSKLNDAETGQRGYVITGNPAYLAPYNESLAYFNSPDAKKFLDDELDDSNAQFVDKVKEIESLRKQKFEELALVIEMRKNQGLEAAIAHVQMGKGKNLMDKARELINSIIADNKKTIDSLDKSIQEYMGKTHEFLLVSDSIASLLMALCIFSLYRSMRREEVLSHQLNDALTTSNTTLEKLKETYDEVMLKQNALNDDLQAAAIIQQTLLPLRKPQIPNLDVHWLCHPCELVGGDICSLKQVNNESSIFYVLDVSGHGVPSAMVTVSVTQFLQELGLASISPKNALDALNRSYPFEKFNMFSTIFYMTFNSEKGKLTYSSAGHPPAVYLSPKKPYQLLNTKGMLIGVDPNFSFEEQEATLQKGDKIFLYTDGIIEYLNHEGEQFGEERFFDLLEKSKSHSIKEIVQILNESIKKFGNGRVPKDDISILGIEYLPK